MQIHGVVSIAFPKNKREGNGILISDRLVLTCQHVVQRAQKTSKIWVDGTRPAKILHAAKDPVDLAILELEEPLSWSPIPWKAAGNPGDKVAYVGEGHPGTELTIMEVCSEYQWLTLKASPFAAGTSGGGVFRSHGAQVFCIGLLVESGPRATGTGAVKAFCQSHGIELPEAPPLPKSAPARQYDASKYLEWLRGETRQIDFRGLKAGKKEVAAYPMDDLYIPLMTNPSARAAKHEAAPLEEVLGNHRRLVIQGDAGSGKTTFLRHEAWQSCRENARRPGFPLLVSIARLDTFIGARLEQRDFPTEADAPTWLARYLEDQGRERGWDMLDRGFFEGKLRQRDTVVLLDGLDEAGSVHRREQIARLFEALVGKYPACRWVVTTRPGAYEGKSTLTSFAVTSILDLEPGQISGFLYRWSLCLKDGDKSAATGHSRDLQKALDNSPWEIRQMGRNPLMLSALAVVHYNEKRLPDQRAALYECILEWLAKSREEKPGRKKALPEELLRRFGYLALTMQDYGKKGAYQTRISRSEAAGLLAEKFKLDDAEGFLAQEEVDSGIVTSEGGKEIKFYHRSYQEYLAARYIAKLRSKLRWPEVTPRLERPEWRETFVLLAGCLFGQSKDVLDEFLEELMAYGLRQKKLEARARIVGLTAAMLADLRAAKYEIGGEAAADYEKLREGVTRIFEPGGAPDLGVKTRAAVADALGMAGHPGLCLPGDEKYWAKVSDSPLAIGRYPVTVHEYARYVDAGGAKPGEWEKQLQTPSRPVVRVNWHEAVAYCSWVKGVRLPTNAEWTLAAGGAGRQKREYPWGDGEPSEERANYDNKVGYPTAVGLFPLGNTPDGVADLAGNVWEWTAERSVRGGAFYYFATGLRAAYRLGRIDPDSRFDYLGFRLVRE